MNAAPKYVVPKGDNDSSDEVRGSGRAVSMALRSSQAIWRDLDAANKKLRHLKEGNYASKKTADAEAAKQMIQTSIQATTTRVMAEKRIQAIADARLGRSILNFLVGVSAYTISAMKPEVQKAQSQKGANEIELDSLEEELANVNRRLADYRKADEIARASEIAATERLFSELSPELQAAEIRERALDRPTRANVESLKRALSEPQETIEESMTFSPSTR